MAVDQEEAHLEDEELEFQGIFAVIDSRHGFRRNDQEPALNNLLQKPGRQVCCSQGLWSPLSQLFRRLPFRLRVPLPVLESLWNHSPGDRRRHG